MAELFAERSDIVKAFSHELILMVVPLSARAQTQEEKNLIQDTNIMSVEQVNQLRTGGIL